MVWFLIQKQAKKHLTHALGIFSVFLFLNIFGDKASCVKYMIFILFVAQGKNNTSEVGHYGIEVGFFNTI